MFASQLSRPGLPELVEVPYSSLRQATVMKTAPVSLPVGPDSVGC